MMTKSFFTKDRWDYLEVKLFRKVEVSCDYGDFVQAMFFNFSFEKYLRIIIYLRYFPM